MSRSYQRECQVLVIETLAAFDATLTWLFAVLLGSAVVVALAQQTLP